MMVKWDFSVEEMTTFGRDGSLPTGYIDALLARSKALNAHLTGKIAATLPAGKNDPHCRPADPLPTLRSDR